MKITKVYLDLKEAKPEQRLWKDVWVLESEAFKDPLTFQMEYDPKDLERIKEVQQEVNERLEKSQQLLDQEKEYSNNLIELNNKLKEELLLKEQQLQEQREEISKKERIENRLKKEIEKHEMKLEKQSEGIINNTDKISRIEQKLTKQPTVLSDTTFLSWIGESFLTIINLPDGEYLYIQKTKITEKNEYVANEDDVIINKIHVNDGMFPATYTLKGIDALSTPTATIDRTLVFIPI